MDNLLTNESNKNNLITNHKEMNEEANKHVSTTEIKNHVITVSPEERFYINLFDFIDLLSNMVERANIKVNPVIFIISKNYIENIEKKKILDIFIEASIKDNRCIWDNIIKRDIKFCLKYFIDYINTLTKIDVMKVIDQRDPEKLFNQIFSNEEDLNVFWEYIKSFIRITINYIKNNIEKIPENIRNILNQKELERYQEIFKKN